MSTKRKHRPSTSSSGERRINVKTDEEKAEPDPKKSKKDAPASTATFTPPTRESGGTLGGLPLYGERLPPEGYGAIPATARKACEKLREIMVAVKNCKSTTRNKEDDETAAQRRAGVLSFAQLRQLNRLSNLYSKDTRDRTQDRKLGVDELFLQLQNLQYEAKHLQKEVTSCLEFRSKHEDLELITEEEFYEMAPQSLTNPEVTKTDSHKLMLARLEWELKQREQLASRQSSLEVSIKAKQDQTQKLEEKLSRLRPSLENLRAASLPLQEFFDIPLDWEREQHRLAALLPRPLYMLYVQSEGYSLAEDTLMKVIVNGNLEEARAFIVARQREENNLEEAESGQEAESSIGKKKKRRKSTKASEEDGPPFKESFPLSVTLQITTKAVGFVKIAFHYLPFFNAVCCSVTGLELDPDHAELKELFVDKSILLHNLFEGDSGKTSPNVAVSAQIRKYGGGNFSTAVRQYGFPFKWVQQVCGISASADVADFADLKLDRNVSASSLADVVLAIRSRMRCQLSLTKQLFTLEQLKMSISEGEAQEDQSMLSQLSRWKQLSLSEVQTSQFGCLAIFNLQERANRFFLATFNQNSVRWHCIICLSMDYPRAKPVLSVVVELSEKQREPYNLQLKNIEADVNIHYPLTLPPDRYGANLLTLQLARAQTLLEKYVQYRTSSTSLKSLSLCPRGKGRLLTALH